MKKILPFLLLTLAACGGEPISEPDEETPPSEESYEQPPDTIYNESTGESEDVHTSGVEKQTYRVDTNDIVIRMLVCNYIPLLIDTNPVTGEGIYLIKWHCPPGFH